MAKNTGDKHRIGSIKDRSQFHNEMSDTYCKRDAITGRIMEGKQDTPFKGVAKEPDGRKK